MPAPQISPLPNPPSRSQSPETFSTDADAFLGALPDFQSEANDQADYLDALAIAVDVDAAAADADAAAALASQIAAAASETAAALSETNAAASEVAAAGSETAAGISETNAAASEAAAAASAAEAEAIVAGVGFKDIVFINAAMSPYTINSATNGKLIACDTSGGNIVINLALISSLTLPFTGGVKKTTSDGNTVTINCAVGNTFDDGTTSKSVSVPAGFTLLPDIDTSPDVWVAIGFGGATAGPVTGSGLTMSTDKLLGRNTAGTGAIEEIAHASLAEMQAGTETALRGMSPANISQAIDALAGDVLGPASATANGIALYDGTSGKLLKSGLNNGTAGQVLTSAGAGVNPTWAALPPSGPTHTATLSGTLANGSTVIVNPDGTVTPAQGPTELLGSSVIFSLYEIQTTDSTYDTANQKIVIVYRDGDNLYYAVVGTVSGTTISFGTPVTFADSLGFTAICRVVYHAAAQKVVIVYTISGSTYSKVGTVSGTSISFGAQVGMPLSITQNDNSAITYDSTNQKIVVIAQSSTYGTACVGTVSGTSISFGSGVDIFSSQVSSATTAMCFDPSTSKVVVASSRSGNGFAAVVGTVSGTSISFGAEITWGFSGATTPQRLAMAYDSFNQKVVIFYKTSLNSTVYAVAATISGTTITLSAASGGLSADTLSRFTASYNVLQNLVCVGIRNTSGFFAVGYHRITGGTPTYVSAVNFTSNATTDSVIAYDPIQEREVGAFNFGSKGRAAVFRYGTSVTNVTAENFIGFSNAAYTNGQTATIQVIGSVDDAQSGLTAGQSYFVMTNGTLSLTAGSPSIFAGTAVSATQIIVKG